MWQMAYEFHYTYVMEQNVFMQKYVLNTSSVSDTLLDSEETTVNNKDAFSQKVYILRRVKTISKHSIGT